MSNKKQIDCIIIIYNQISTMQLTSKQIHQFTTSLICSKKQHMGQQISHFCVEETCPKKELCCLLCQDEAHRKHLMVNIKIMLFQVLEAQSLQADVLVLSAEIDRVAANLEIAIDRASQFLQDFGNVRNAVMEFMKFKRNSVLRMLEFPAEVSVILKGNSPPNSIVDFYIKYETYFDLDPKKEEPTTPLSIYSEFLKRTLHELKQIQICFQKLEKSDRITDSNILALFPLNQLSFKSFKPYFSETMKPSNVNITATTAQVHTSSSQRVIALEPSLDSNSREKKWRIKITKLSSWIGVGACHIQKLKEADWHFNYSSPNHGSYFVSSNGYSWSSYKPEFNSKFEPFSFKTGDIIKLEYSPRQKLLKLQKQQQNKTYSLQIDDNGDALHPAVNLTSVGDSVQILD